MWFIIYLSDKFKKGVDALDGMREKRQKRKWNAEDLAKKVGCSAQMIYLIERGEANPSLELLKKIAEVLECKIDDLL